MAGEKWHEGIGASAAGAISASVVALTIEVVLAWFIRDNLSLNVLMLIHPIDAVRRWQAAVGGVM